MNAKQLQYATALAKVRNFSQVADTFHISQPALSKQIQSLENELGIKLFDRNSIPLTITAAGAYFVQEAQQLLYREDQLIRSMEQFKSGEKGRLEIGISPFRNLFLMPPVLTQIRKKYPGIQIVLHEHASDQLRNEMAEGKYDFAIVNLPVSESVFDYLPLEPETLVLAVPNQYAPQVQNSGEELPLISLSDCQDIPFVVVAQPQEMRLYFDRLCEEAGFLPNIAIEVAGGITTAWSMARSGLGATLLPMQFVRAQSFEHNLTLFRLKGKVFSRQPVIITRRGQYLSEHAKYAMGLLQSSSAV